MVMKERVVVTSLKTEADFATLYYIVEHDIAEARKKKMDWKTYLVVVASIDNAN